MSKMWRIVLYAAAALLVLGMILLGAAWLTGASVSRIVELVFGGREELDVWLREGLGRAQALWTALRTWVQSLF